MQHEVTTTKPAAVIIKKYGNRRLYDTTASRYVNLDDIARLIRDGKEVLVIDARTGEDFTRVTLTQIITEDAKNKPAGLPLELLRQLVVASDEVRQGFLMWYLKSAFDAYQRMQDSLQSRLGEVQNAVMSPVDAMRRFLSSTATPEKTEVESEVEALRRRVAELEARLERNTERNANKQPRSLKRGKKK